MVEITKLVGCSLSNLAPEPRSCPATTNLYTNIELDADRISEEERNEQPVGGVSVASSIDELMKELEKPPQAANRWMKL